ncbi:MAG TPA: lamin tail domain-containing protein, partial [Saprospiraceae bacterium]|nr:lamin tail domain-containing protein [Saprospiraceae bacterium]
MKSIYLFAVLFLFISIKPQAQIIFSEVSPTNAYQLADENDDYPDWIEIFNSGSSDQNLVGFSLSDNNKPKWTFPDFT